jgi:hypothetical protein
MYDKARILIYTTISSAKHSDVKHISNPERMTQILRATTAPQGCLLRNGVLREYNEAIRGPTAFGRS